MPESFVQVAPDSTGKKLRTRQRTVAGNTVEEQYAVATKEPQIIVRTWVSTFRQLVPRAALTTTAFNQPVFSVWNGGSNIVSVRRIVCEVDSIVAKATGVVVPWLRLYRVTAAPTNGTALTPVQQDLSDTALSATVVVRGDASADGTVSASALTATASPTTSMWEQTLPVWGTTIAGYMVPSVMTLVPDDPGLMSEDPLFLRPNQGMALFAEGTAQTYGAGDWSLHVKAVVAEFTYP